MCRLVEMLPRLQPHYGKLPEILPAVGKRRARVGLFLGCVADGLFPQTNLATARVLQANGCEVVTPRRQGCCGALHQHMGEVEQARVFARANLEAFGSAGLDAVISNAAGCGAMLKEYDRLLDDEPSRAFSSRVRDISEFLVELGLTAPLHPLRVKAVYHDACHLCHAQKIRQPPRDLLSAIPGLELAEAEEPEVCCGAAGSYSLTQPDMSDRLGARKAARLLEAGAHLVASGNVGCLLQIGKHLRRLDPTLRVVHVMDVLWASLAGQNGLSTLGLRDVHRDAPTTTAQSHEHS
jgi:glycolate oxidase iron-sulfur subunit